MIEIGALESQGGFPRDPGVGSPWDLGVGAHGIPGWALGDPGPPPMGPWGRLGDPYWPLGVTWALGGPWGVLGGPWGILGAIVDALGSILETPRNLVYEFLYDRCRKAPKTAPHGVIFIPQTKASA